MDASDFKVFEAVARLGSMNRAALELNTVQSNVTTKIRHLAGLGLAIVKETMKAHGGGVTVSDNPGGGALFTLAFASTNTAAEANISSPG